MFSVLKYCRWWVSSLRHPAPCPLQALVASPELTVLGFPMLVNTWKRPGWFRLQKNQSPEEARLFTSSVATNRKPTDGTV